MRETLTVQVLSAVAQPGLLGRLGGQGDDHAGEEGAIRVSVEDDGARGADPARGSGLVGLKDRVEALGGAISVQSPPGAGTSVRVELPLSKALMFSRSPADEISARAGD